MSESFDEAKQKVKDFYLNHKNAVKFGLIGTGLAAFGSAMFVAGKHNQTDMFGDLDDVVAFGDGEPTTMGHLKELYTNEK
jgi:hypothetical protein